MESRIEPKLSESVTLLRVFKRNRLMLVCFLRQGWRQVKAQLAVGQAGRSAADIAAPLKCGPTARTTTLLAGRLWRPPLTAKFVFEEIH